MITGLQHDFYLSANPLWVKIYDLANAPNYAEITIVNTTTDKGYNTLKKNFAPDGTCEFNIMSIIEALMPYPDHINNNNLNKFNISIKVKYKNTTIAGTEYNFKRYVIRGGANKQSNKEQYIDSQSKLIVGKWLQWEGLTLPDLPYRLYEIMYTFRIFPSPSDATVVINGLPQNEITTSEDELITWEVSKDSYTTQSGSFTITSNVDYNIELLPISILNIPFNNNFNELTGNNSVIAGGTANLPTFVTGRRGTDYAASFNGSQSVKTSSNVLINGDKVSISFWMKTTQNTIGAVTELSTNANNKNAFMSLVNESSVESGVVGRLMTSITQTGGTYNTSFTNIDINDGNWRHFVILLDRSVQSLLEAKIYINGQSAYTKTQVKESAGDFINDILYIGQRGGNTLGFNGHLQEFKVFNFILTNEDIERLYRE